jgi:hypothetical protein
VIQRPSSFFITLLKIGISLTDCLEVNRGTKPVLRDLCEVPHVPGTFNMLTGKCVIEKRILENILNNTNAQVVVPFCVGENRSVFVRTVRILCGLWSLRYAFVPLAFVKPMCGSHKEDLACRVVGIFHHIRLNILPFQGIVTLHIARRLNQCSRLSRCGSHHFPQRA